MVTQGQSDGHLTITEHLAHYDLASLPTSDDLPPIFETVRAGTNHYPYRSECGRCDAVVVIDGGWVNDPDGSRHVC